MKIIRIYDNKRVLFDELYLGGVFDELVDTDTSVEYCALIEDRKDRPINYCCTQGKQKGEIKIEEKYNWDFSDNIEDRYYVFLDTFWEPYNASHDDDAKYGVPKKLLEKDFTNNRVVSLTIYSCFDSDAALELDKNIRAYRTTLEKNVHFPVIRKLKKISYDGDKENIVFFSNALTE